MHKCHMYTKNIEERLTICQRIGESLARILDASDVLYECNFILNLLFDLELLMLKKKSLLKINFTIVTFKSIILSYNKQSFNIF